MTISRSLYKNLPLYSRATDSEGKLELLVERGIQVELDRLYAIIADRGLTFDPSERASEEHLDWLAQLFGLYRSKSGNWVGTGLNPKWSPEYKRYVIEQISSYWRIKGTSRGIIRAIELWLEWPSPDVEIIQPYPDSWCRFGDNLSYDTGIFEQKRLGSGLTSGLHEQNIWLILRPPDARIAEAIHERIERLIIESSDIRSNVTPILWWPSKTMTRAPDRVIIKTDSGRQYDLKATMFDREEMPRRSQFACLAQSPEEIKSISYYSQGILVRQEIEVAFLPKIKPGIIIAWEVVEDKNAIAIAPKGASSVLITAGGDLVTVFHSLEASTRTSYLAFNGSSAPGPGSSNEEIESSALGYLKLETGEYLELESGAYLALDVPPNYFLTFETGEYLELESGSYLVLDL